MEDGVFVRMPMILLSLSRLFGNNWLIPCMHLVGFVIRIIFEPYASACVKRWSRTKVLCWFNLALGSVSLGFATENFNN
ncbi:MAG TPA: hypothetical protein PLP17_05060 [Oligoflexia bacterium]|nr:hypothetical protein [Oligoflexia bacterium]